MKYLGISCIIELVLNINTKSFRNKNTPIFLMIKDQIVSEKLKNSLKFFFIDEKYSDKNIIKNYKMKLTTQ